MTALFGTESFESGTDGTAVTTDLTAFTQVLAGFTFADTPAPPVGLGLLRGLVDVAAATTSYAQASFAATPRVVSRAYVRLPSVPTSGVVDLAVARAGAATIPRARLSISGGKFVIRDAHTAVWTSTMSVPANTEFRLEWWLDNAAGTQQLRIFKGANVHGTTPDEVSGSRTFTSGAQVDVVRFGAMNNTLTTTFRAYFDAVIISDTTWPGPAYTAPTTGPVTVSAGADQIAVEPWAPITLSASLTGATATGWAWTQLQGPTVTLTDGTTATATFDAPATIAGASCQFQVEAAYVGGSAVDYVNVTVRAVTERAVVGFKEVPMRVLSVPGTPTSGWGPAASWLGGTAWGDH